LPTVVLTTCSCGAIRIEGCVITPRLSGRGFTAPAMNVDRWQLIDGLRLETGRR
jgi:hypothetical protein